MWIDMHLHHNMLAANQHVLVTTAANLMQPRQPDIVKMYAAASGSHKNTG
jgi:hypothetical protein